MSKHNISRRTQLAWLTVATALFLSAACGPTPDTAARPATLTAEQKATLVKQAGAPLFEGLGDYHRKISTKSEGAQRYFNQGMTIAFGFNHAESVRSFKAAQRLDPTCAMCFWGEALATGPNINVTSNGKAIMSDDERKNAFTAVQQAMALGDGGTEQERAFIAALSTRYDGNPETERAPLDLAYADAMRDLAKAYPLDDDAQVMFAESLMTTMPWDYWLKESEPKPGTVEVINALETVIERSPEHALALHLYIHAVEASTTPERAEPAADQLLNLVPASGHLVHMPGHIYWRVGRYDDASEANIRAAAIDEEYIAQCNAQGFYPAAYYPHNIHFLWAASTMQGRSALSLESARKVADNVHLEQIKEFPTIEAFKTIPLLSLARFNRWDDVLAEEQPHQDLDFSNGIWHYARGVALAHAGNLKGARAEQKALVPLQQKTTVKFLDSVDYPASALLEIANHLLLGEIAKAAGDKAGAIKHFEMAVAGQDGLPYTEPPFWYYPSRQSLGAALLAADRAADAEAVYRRDLDDYPHNGWSMFGLLQSLEAQNKDTTMAREHFDVTWAKADVELIDSTTVEAASGP